MTPAQKILRDKINKTGRILSKSEAFDVYTEHVMKSFMSCRLYKRNYSDDYSLWELEEKAYNWYKLNLGSLFIQGELGFNNDINTL